MTEHLHFDEYEKRAGRFRITNHVFVKFPASVNAIISNVIILKVKDFKETDQVEYTAISPLFDLLERADEPPEYDIIMEWEEATKSHLVRANKKIAMPEVPA